MKKTTFIRGTVALVVLAALAALVGCNPKDAGPTAEELFLAQLATQKEGYIAQQKDAEARVAEVIPDAIAETYKGKSILEIAEAEGHNSRLMTITLARLATSELDARESWREFVQTTVWALCAIAFLVLLIVFMVTSDAKAKGHR